MLRMLGRILQLEGLLLLVPTVVAFIYGESPRPFLLTLVPLLAVGTLLARLRAKADFFTREGYMVVGMIWLALCLTGAMPFWLSGEFASFWDCLFEITSGFTTSGATILPDIERLPRGILFWRSFSSWVGGMGILLFTLAFLPRVGGRNQILVQAEMPGPLATKLVPKTVQSTQILYIMYIALTVAEIFAFSIAGMPFFDAVVSTFASICTGGFAIWNASFAAYNTACQIIAIVFMILGSLNFALFFLTLSGRIRDAMKSDELRFFLLVAGAASVLVFLNILPLYRSPAEALKDAVFQVVSIQSTSGFSTTDYNLWPAFSRSILVLLMFVGGCSGSTAGSIKCGRLLLMFRCAKRSILRLSHPRAVKVVKLDGKIVDENTLNTVFAFFICFCILLAVGTVAVTLDGADLVTAFTTSLGAITNVGPGLGMVGPMENFSFYSGWTKAFLSFMMVVGRLEIFPILLLFQPSIWRHHWPLLSHES